ncbi:MAG: 2-C-methyl-D-erythritol 4-phosphate cytidylyltransferase [Leptospiraceae bacterium]|nr:2-C-methyl-D-erythritol 4-phosphate cytidylyltransferase [Leptospiraceae bacterium]MDW7975506.1 2-C-methyl-D-erythritol 4-phosphate cytidylyltransferase [Leptospiraceae bacterium]
MTYHIYAILLAGGIGSRIGGEVPKQFQKLDGHTLAEYSILRFQRWFQGISHVSREKKNFKPESMVMVIHKDYFEYARELYRNYDLLFTQGGENRHDSTKQGLIVVKADSEKKQLNFEQVLVFIHDTARPLFLLEDLDRCMEAFLQSPSLGGISLAAPIHETVVQKLDTIKPIDRNTLFVIKTPQLLNGRYLELFLKKPTEIRYTDLLTWCDEHKIPYDIVVSESHNIKITYKEDFPLVKSLLGLKKYQIEYEP